ncbi:hypothetical protein CSB09_01140 [Candidatus Gracilibacteria bacterium]|nr:MAG: hypothetical protein CSB09_01140 [Candidatus Gracilibacteria bacterium]
MKFISDIITFFRDIFIEKSGEDDFLITVKNYTQIYKNQFEKNYLNEIIVACAYKEIENDLKMYKYQSQQYKSKKIIRAYIEIFTKYSHTFGTKNIAIVPVPTHWRRKVFRGFDHMKYISKKLSKKINIPALPLLSTKYTPQQSKLPRSKRLKNKIHAFRVKSSYKIPKKIILIDDVISTGATANECAKVLKQSGVQKVYGCFLATNQ